MSGDGTDASVADAVVAEIAATGGRAVASHDSVDTPGGGQAIVDQAMSSFGRLDAVVSNAGIFQTRPFEELTPDDWQRMRSVHLDGAFYLAQPAYRVMKAQGYGRFVMIASSAGLFGQPHAAHYSAAKAGVFGLTNVIAVEGAPHGILANAVLPFGQSRMVWETARRTARRRRIVHHRDPTRVGRTDGRVPREPNVHVQSSQLFRRRGPIRARVRRSRARAGWRRAASQPTADDIDAHIDEVSATEPFIVPMSIVDEVIAIATRLGIRCDAMTLARNRRTPSVTWRCQGLGCAIADVSRDRTRTLCSPPARTLAARRSSESSSPRAGANVGAGSGSVLRSDGRDVGARRRIEAHQLSVPTTPCSRSRRLRHRRNRAR